MEKRSLVFLALLLSSFLLLLSVPNYSAPVPPEKANQVVSNVIISKTQALPTMLQEVEYTVKERKELRGENGELLGYVFEINPQGYFVTSSDTNINPIIAYSYRSDFSWRETPLNQLLYLVKRDLELRAKAVEQDAFPDQLAAANRSKWENYTSTGVYSSIQAGATQWGPHIQFPAWSQGPPYNDEVPIDPSTDERSLVGCVATAMAQIINYWNYPNSINFTDQQNYTTDTRGISIDADAADIPDINYSSDPTQNPSDEMEAALSYAAGVSVEMDYTSDLTEGSVASTSDVAIALAGGTFFSDIEEVWGYNSAWWDENDGSNFYDNLTTDMQNDRPAQMGIVESGKKVGHSIVVDGYRSSDEKYHLNYGWGPGEENNVGWYDLPKGLPSDYDTVRGAVIDIEAPTTYIPSPSITSTTHPDQNSWYNNAEPQFSWSEPSSPANISGYSYKLNRQGTFTPDKTVDTSSKTKSYSNLDDGEWYFHVRATSESGDWGSTGHYEINVDTTAPTAEFTYDPDKPTAQDTVYFNDNSTDGGSGIASWSWELGDGASSTQQDPAHFYDDDGTYIVSLTVEDRVGLTAGDSAKISVLNVGPTASFTYSPLEPKSTDNVQFTDQSTDVDGTVESFSWEFGGGGTSNKENPTHKYLASGEFTVQLKVTDDDGATSSTTDTIDVQNVPPTADFSFSPGSPFVDERANFTNESSDPEGNMEKYEWGFGDGSSSQKENPTHEYVDDLTFTVTLTVEDVHGLTDSIEKVIKVINLTEEMGSYSPNSPGDVDNPDQFIGRKEVHYAVWSFLSGEKLSDLNRSLPKKWAREIISYYLMEEKIPQDEDQEASEQAQQAARHLTQAFLNSSLPRQISKVLTTLDNDDPIESLKVRVFSIKGKLEYEGSCMSINQSSWSFLLERVETDLEGGVYHYLIKARETDGEVRRTGLRKLYVQR